MTSTSSSGSLAAALRSDADMSLARFEPGPSPLQRWPAHSGVPSASGWRFTVMPTSTRWPIAAAAVIGVIVVGGLFYVNRPDRSAVGDPSPTPSDASQPGRRGRSKPDAYGDAQPHAHADPVDRGESDGGLARAGPPRARRRRDLVPILMKQRLRKNRPVTACRRTQADTSIRRATRIRDFPWVDIQEVVVGEAR